MQKQKKTKIWWGLFVITGIVISITLGSIALYRINNWSTVNSGDGKIRPGS